MLVNQLEILQSVYQIRKIGREVYCRCFESSLAGLSPARGFESYIFRQLQFWRDARVDYGRVLERRWS